MNSCVLMGVIMSDPELRYTPDKLEVTQMLLEFDTQQTDRTNNSPIMARLKVVGFGNLAKEVKDKYAQGDRVVVVGRLGMNTIERDGYTEKRAELSLYHIYPIGADITAGNGAVSFTTTSSEFDSSSQINSQTAREKVVPLKPHTASEPEYEMTDTDSYGYDSDDTPAADKDLDNIPF
jgi:single-stranded DNA-binding protein